MNRKKLLITAKFLINSGILCLLPLPLLSYEAENKAYIALFALVLILIGCCQCFVANKAQSGKVMEDNRPKRFPMIWYFKTIKWSLIAAIVFHIIAACVILFFYWLKREFEVTLLITLGAGIAIGLVCEVAIPYYKKNKDKPN